MDIPFGQLHVTPRRHHSSCLNPYCNGYSFRTSNFLCLYTDYKLVLILIVMDIPFGQYNMKAKKVAKLMES